MLGAVSAGGVVGAEARYVLSLFEPSGAGFPWATLAQNVSGCLLIGVLMTVVRQSTAPHWLIRPFLGVGLLGGYTTFSTYAVDVHQMLIDGRHVVAVTYLVATPVVAVLAAWSATAATRAVLRRRRPRGGMT